MRKGIVILFLSTLGCVSFFKPGGGHDSQPLNIQNLNLFNQRIPSRLSELNWAGDWIFRRERLNLIDQELRSFKPDLFVFQEIMQRRGSPTESDENILRAGSLAGYKFSSASIKEYQDTRENEKLGVGITLPLSFDEKIEKGVWPIGDDGAMSAHAVKFGKQNMVVFSLKMSAAVEKSHLWFRFIRDKARDYIKKNKLCYKRVVLAGFIPVRAESEAFQSFMTSMNLKDVASETCGVSCNTAHPSNELYMSTSKKIQPARYDRILVSNDAIVYSGRVNFRRSQPISAYSKKYGIDRLFSAVRYGWASQVLLPRCSEDELDAFSGLW